MFKMPYVGRCAAALVVVSLSAAPAAALTGEDVMTKMGEDERGGYLTGSVEAAAFLALSAGDKERSSCIVEWFFGDGNGPEQIAQAFNHFRERQAQPIIYALINRACTPD